MTLERLEVDFDGPVARIWLNRPDVRNAFDGLMVTELRKTLFDLRTADAVRVIVLGGRGAAFSAGADLAWMKAMAGFSREENLREAQALADLFFTVYNSPKPVVARVHGAALGGGAGLVAVCDIAVAADTTVFAFSEAKLGIVPAVISPYVIAKIGVSAARELFLTAARFDAGRAKEIGLVHAVVPEARLDDAIDSYLRDILSCAPSALAVGKRLIREVQGRRPDEVIGLTTATIAEQRTSADGQEGMQAFLEKRKPRWVS